MFRIPALLAALFLCALPAVADSGEITQNVQGNVSFTYNGQSTQESFSYTLSGEIGQTGMLAADATLTNLQFSSSGAFGPFTLTFEDVWDQQWTDAQGLVFALSPISVAPSSFQLEMHLITPYGPYIPDGGRGVSAQVVPEPQSLALLFVGLLVIAMRRHWKLMQSI